MFHFHPSVRDGKIRKHAFENAIQSSTSAPNWELGMRNSEPRESRHAEQSGS
jgi:hypothetical protein